MIALEKLEYLAAEKEKENFKFRTFLKNHADPDKLDEQFKMLHDKYFSLYDCSTCRSCCRKYCGTIPGEDIKEDAEFLGMTQESFKAKYLSDKPGEGGYKAEGLPCDFLQDNICILEDHKPDSCKKFPYTDQPDRMGSLLSIIDNTRVCPVVYEIMEELKVMYNFR